MTDPVIVPLSIRLLGPFEVLLSGEPLPRLRSRTGQWLLALLTLRAGSPVDRSWLAGTLWPDSPQPQAFTSLRVTLADLRRALGSEAPRLHSPTPQTLALDLSEAEADVVAFDQAIATGDPASLEAAVGLYRGPLLEGCAEGWVLQERERREQAYLEALETLATQAREQRDAAGAERYLRQAVGVDPLRESAQRALMQALAAGGNYAAAVEVYRALRERLHGELNTLPDPETQTLFQQLRAEARGRAQAPHATAPAPSSSPSTPARSPLPEGTVTFLLTDIEGSTRLWDQHPEPMRQALARHHALLAQVIEQHDGVVITSQGEGDSFFAVFPHGTDAVAAATALQQVLQAEPWPFETPIRVRMALHTGEAEVREGNYYGVAVNRCARLRSAGHGGQVLLSRATQEVVRDHLPEGVSLWDLGECRLKDLTRPEHVFQLRHPGLPTEFPPLRGLDARANNLPAQPTPLIGREREVEQLRELLRREEVRLVTLTGPGGTGKTRLGLQVGADLLDDLPSGSGPAFADGVFFINLAPIRDRGLLPSTIAQALGVQESGGQPLLDSLKNFLRQKQMLIVLDNFEQIVEAAPIVSELIEAAPRLKVLVTSRAVLRVRGEHEFPVPPLSLPDLQRLPRPEALSQYAAVELFIQRAVAVRPDFTVTEENGRAVAEICGRLDGLPLAIELAAARTKLLPPVAMLPRLENRLQLLTSGTRDLPTRQQTLRNTIAWSYDLLDEAERALFRRLSVFLGGFTLEAAEAVCKSEGDPSAGSGQALDLDLLDGVAQLIDKSLLKHQEGVRGEPRFTMLETLREYGLECLSEGGEASTFRRQHAQFFLSLAEQVEPRLFRAGQREWLERLERDYDNLRAALEWCRESGEAEAGLRLGGALWRFWWMRDSLAEGRERLADQLNRAPIRSAAWVKAQTAAGFLAFMQNDYLSCRQLSEEGLAVARELGDKPGIAAALRNLGGRAFGQRDQRDPAGARRLLGEALMLWRELGDRWHIALSQSWLGHTARLEGDAEEAVRLHQESLAIWRELGDQFGMQIGLNCLGHEALVHRDWKTAHALLHESLTIGRELGAKRLLHWSLANLGEMAELQGDYDTARLIFEEAQVLQRERGINRDTASGLSRLGWVALRQEDLRRARTVFAESLTLRHELKEDGGIAECLRGLAAVACAQRRAEQAARLLGAAEALDPATDARSRAPDARAACERCSTATQTMLGEEAFAAAWAEGQAMTLPQAVAHALEGDEGS